MLWAHEGQLAGTLALSVKAMSPGKSPGGGKSHIEQEARCWSPSGQEIQIPSPGLKARWCPVDSHVLPQGSRHQPPPAADLPGAWQPHQPSTKALPCRPSAQTLPCQRPPTSYLLDTTTLPVLLSYFPSLPLSVHLHAFYVATPSRMYLPTCPQHPGQLNLRKRSKNTC